jgi:hypothetical protein
VHIVGFLLFFLFTTLDVFSYCIRREFGCLCLCTRVFVFVNAGMHMRLACELHVRNQFHATVLQF